MEVDTMVKGKSKQQANTAEKKQKYCQHCAKANNKKEKTHNTVDCWIKNPTKAPVCTAKTEAQQTAKPN